MHGVGDMFNEMHYMYAWYSYVIC